MKNKIIKVSIPLFDEKGYSETSIQDIVDCIGVTKGTFYYYYKTKQELLGDISLGYIKQILEQQKEILANKATTHEEKMENIVLMILSNIRELKQSARIFNREMRHIEEATLSEIIQIRRQFKDNLQNLIDDGIKAGIFKNHSETEIIALGILGITNWTYYWYDPDGTFDEVKVSKLLMQLIRDGIKK